MEEHFHRLYSKEEEFLDKYGSCASVAAGSLKGEWKPDHSCNDHVRATQSYLKSSGELSYLVFETAAVFRNFQGFSSVQIVLRSSTRTVTVRVRKDGSDLVAEKIVDRIEGA